MHRSNRRWSFVGTFQSARFAKIFFDHKIPFDKFCPSVSDTCEKLNSAICNVFFARIESNRLHNKMHKKRKRIPMTSSAKLYWLLFFPFVATETPFIGQMLCVTRYTTPPPKNGRNVTLRYTPHPAPFIKTPLRVTDFTRRP